MTKSIPTTANKSNDNTALKDIDLNRVDDHTPQRGEKHSMRDDESRYSERSDGSRRTPQKTTQS